MAELPDGTFNVVGDTVEVLAASDLTRERLARLARIVDAAQAGEMTEDQAARAVAEEAPAIGSLIDRLGPKMGRALVVLLFAAIQLLAAQALAEHRDDSASKEDVTDAVNRAFEQCQDESP